MKVSIVFQVRLPTGTVIHVRRVGGVFLNTVIYLSAADYNQTAGKVTRDEISIILMELIKG